MMTSVKIPVFNDHQSITHLNPNATKNQLNSTADHKQPNKFPPTVLPELTNNLLPT